GLIFAVLAMGVFITYKILDMPDLSVEGTFPFGAFLFARFVSSGIDPIISTLMAFGFGTLAGLSTAILFTKLKIKPILAGILTMTILYSVNLKTNGKANISLFDYDLIFDKGSKLLILIIIVLFIKIFLDLFLKTETGYLLIATGDNEPLVRSIGENSDKYKILGLMLANGLVALSGALMAQYQGFADMTMGHSIIVVALASIIIGDTIRKDSHRLKDTTRAIIGAIIYRLIGGIAIDLGLDPQDLRAVNALIVIIFIYYNNFVANIFSFGKFKGGKGFVKNN
ncbi:MAG: ABC transporter permease, partial [Tissierellia bacterium]|nr:ABC transporter permease [Tissierellia bacterium]